MNIIQGVTYINGFIMALNIYLKQNLQKLKSMELKKVEKTQAVVDISISHRVKKCRLLHTWYKSEIKSLYEYYPGVTYINGFIMALTIYL